MAKKPTNYLAKVDNSASSLLGLIVAEHDQELDEYYVASEAYVDRAVNINNPSTFFIGPKGIGKSAILQMVRLIKEGDSNRIVNISPDDLAFSALANVEASTPLLSASSSNKWLFKTLWDYILSLEVLKREYKNESALEGYLHSVFRDKHEREARRLLRLSLDDSGRSISLSERIIQLVKEVEISGGLNQLGVAARATTRDSAGNQLSLLSLVHSVAKTLPDNLTSPYYILIDDLDLHWENKPIQNAFIEALFLSLRTIYKPPHLKCIVALRDRIYEKLDIYDRDKYHDWVCHVVWDKNSVKKMLTKRVAWKLKCAEANVWNGVFPHNGFDKMWMKSNGRPRELIRIASICLAEAKQHGHTRVEDGDIDAALMRYSGERLSDLDSEYRTEYPSLKLLLRKFAGWPKEFPFEKFCKDFAEFVALEVELGEGHSGRYTWAGGYQNSPKDLAFILLDIGFLLVKPSRTAEPQRFDSDIPVEIGNETWFAINYPYRLALGLVGV